MTDPTAINDRSKPAAISTFQMANDPRLARMFAHVGELLWAFDEGEETDHAIEALLDDLLLLAPEFVPPSEDAELEAEWHRLITEATDG